MYFLIHISGYDNLFGVDCTQMEHKFKDRVLLSLYFSSMKCLTVALFHCYAREHNSKILFSFSFLLKGHMLAKFKI